MENRMLEPLKKTRLYEEIVDQLISLMKMGKLKPGDKLPSERQLAEELHVSRTAIREALRSMESMGYIDSKVGGGTYIKSVTLDNVMDPFAVMLSQDEKLLSELVDVRVLLEGEVASLAAKNVTQEQINEVRKTLEGMEADIKAGGNGLSGENAFHNMLAKIADNSALSMILNMCSELLSKSREATLTIPGQPQNSLNDHYEILEAVETHSSALASTLMSRHLRKARKNLEKTNKFYKKDRE